MKMKMFFLFVAIRVVTFEAFANDLYSPEEASSVTCSYSWFGPGAPHEDYEKRSFSASRSYGQNPDPYDIQNAFREAQDEARVRCEFYKLSRGIGHCGFISCR
jgi:hypothetical protein